MTLDVAPGRRPIAGWKMLVLGVCLTAIGVAFTLATYNLDWVVLAVALAVIMAVMNKYSRRSRQGVGPAAHPSVPPKRGS